MRLGDTVVIGVEVVVSGMRIVEVIIQRIPLVII
jgi:hypothetical protein